MNQNRDSQNLSTIWSSKATLCGQKIMAHFFLKKKPEIIKLRKITSHGTQNRRAS